MRVARIVPLVAVAAVAGVAARCSSGGSGGDAKAIKRCDADLSAYLGQGSGAFAKVAAQADLLAGEAATGRPGDVLLANDRIQVVIEQPGRTIGPQPYGGNIIDADIVRPGEKARDRFGEIGALFQFGRTVDNEQVEILRDGKQGGAAVVAATGHDTQLDFINLPGLLSQTFPSMVSQMPDTEADLKLRVTTYYVLPPGQNAVKIVQAYCNDSSDQEALAVGDLVDSGGQVEIYQSSGFSAAGENPSSVLNSLGGKNESFGAWIGPDVAYGYLPQGDTNQIITIAGVTATLLNSESILDWAKGRDNPPQNAIILDPGKSVTVTRDFAVMPEPGHLYSYYYQQRGSKTGTVKGQVVDAHGQGEAGVRVSARQGNKVVSLFTTDKDGRFEGLLPVGDVQLQADDTVTRSTDDTLTVAEGQASDLTLHLAPTGTLVAHVRDAAGGAMPGKVTVVCDGDCPFSRSDDVASRFRDTKSDGLPKTSLGEAFDIRYLQPDGDVSIKLPEGKFKVYFSRGPEYALVSKSVAISADQTTEAEGRLEHVVDTAGWASGDFHVHAINSPDSPIGNIERLTSFMAEGVDVIVSTDHDYITDFSPFMAQIPRSTQFMKAITGEELTTFDYGHYNAFPLVADPVKRNGGAVDWAGGTGDGLTPGEIYDRLQAFDGEQVVQINHGHGSTFTAIGLDTRTFWTRTDGKIYRIHPVAADPATGDTRLWDPKFTAMEVQNGFGGNFAPLMNDWMSFMSRGLVRTGTAVSDTHKRHGNAGYPRTYVRTGEDDPQKLDAQAFAKAVNQGKAFGTNGPFVRVTAKVDGGDAVEIGDTLKSGGKPVTVDVEVRAPEWLDVSTVKLYVNSTGTETDDSGKVPEKLPKEDALLQLQSTLVEVGSAKMRKATATTTLQIPKDAWIVAIVEGTKDMFPVIGKGGATALAFTNPILVDVDGNGWTPPVDLAAERARVGSLKPAGQPLIVPPTEEQLRHVLARECNE